MTRTAAMMIFAVGLASGARAQIATQSKSPIDVTADQAEVVQSKCMAVWRGSAEALQDTSRLRANTITVYSKFKPAHAAEGHSSEAHSSGSQSSGSQSSGSQSACGGTDRIVADGDVYYVTPERNARGDHAVYTPGDDQIVMTGGVIVVQGENVARGDKLIIDVASHQARMVSNVTGAGKSGRVRGVYFPDKTAPPTTPAPSGKP
jgi:lipopolysaccharide export system protein LptA